MKILGNGPYIKKMEIGSDSFFYQNENYTILNWQDSIRQIAMEFNNNHKTKQRFILPLKHDKDKKEVIFGGIKYIHDDNKENKFKAQDIIWVEDSDIGLPFLIEGWKYWFKHMVNHIVNSNKELINFELDLVLEGSIILKEVSV